MIMRDEDLAEKVDRYLDGALSAEDRRLIVNEPELARRFIAELRFQGRVGGLLRQDGRELLGHVEDALDLGTSTGLADRVLARLQPPRQRHWWLWVATPALAAGVAAVVMINLLNLGSDSGVVAAVANGVNIQSERVDLNPGSLLELNVNQEARVAFRDGTRMDLGATASVRLSGIDKSGARISLENGSLSAEVSKQPTGSHFQVATKEALLTVLGTKFTATRMPWGTRVEVTEGRVRTRRETDGKEVEVDAGSRVDVGPGPMSLVPLRPSLPIQDKMLEPTADSVVVGGKYGDENRGLRSSHVVTSPHTKPDELRDYYLRFDLTAITQAPTHAELRLHLTLLRRTGMTLLLSRVDQSWNETTITWNNRPARGATVARWVPDQNDIAIDLTYAVKQALGGQLSLCLHFDDKEKSDAIVGFHTREAAPQLRPQLVMENARNP